MGKITYKNKKGRIIITNTIAYPEMINEHVLNAVCAGIFGGIVPLKVIRRGKKIKLECTVQGMIPVNQYMSGIVSKTTFLNLAYNILILIRECEKNMLNPDNLDLQTDRIFIDPLNGSIKCVLWPVVNNRFSRPPHVFFKQLPEGLQFNVYEDNSYLQQYNAFFNTLSPFSIKSFERMIMHFMGIDNSSNSGPLNENADNKIKAEASFKKDVKIEYDPFDPGLQPRIKGVKEAGREADTGIIGFANEAHQICPGLIRVKTNRIYEVKLPECRIGSGADCSDIFIANNSYISKNHALIVSQNGNYYIVDRGSKNKTYVNGKAVVPEIKTEIDSGTIIRLANEEFIFKIQ